MNKNADTQTAMATEIALPVIANKTTLGEMLAAVACGRTFQSYESKHRKFCSRTCYGKSKEVSHERRDVQ